MAASGQKPMSLDTLRPPATHPHRLLRQEVPGGDEASSDRSNLLDRADIQNQEVVIGSCAWLDRTCGELEFAAAGEGEEHPVVPIVVFEAAG